MKKLGVSESAGINRLETENERVLQRKPSQLSMCRSFKCKNRDKVGKSGLERVREAARKDGKLKFVSLLHHADVDALRRLFYQLKKTAAVGIDGITWQE